MVNISFIPVIELFGNRRFVVKAANNAARGLSKPETIHLDELREYKDEDAWSSMRYSMMAAKNPQVWIYSSAGFATIDFLNLPYTDVEIFDTITVTLDNYTGVDTTLNKRKVVLMLCKLAQDAGAFDQESGKYTKPKVGGDVVNNDTDLVIGTSYFLTTLVSGATAVTIPAKIGYKEIWFTAP